MPSAKQLYEVAVRQNRVVINYGTVYAIMSLMEWFRLRRAAFELGTLPGIGFSLVYFGITAGAVVLAIVLSWQLNTSIGSWGAWSLLLLVPFAGFLFLVYQNLRAREYLLDHGVDSGFLGPDYKQMAVLRRKAFRKKRVDADETSGGPAD